MRLPLWAKLAYTAWMLVWVPTYWIYNGPANFLWLCDIANFAILAALWAQSPLLFSATACGVLLIQTAWILDFGCALLAGFHPIGGTEYMFDPAQPLFVRGLSLFHAFTPPLLLWAVRRLGHDPRGWKLESALASVLLPVTFFATDPILNINWLWGPFGLEQRWLPPAAYLVVCMVAYPLVLFWPTHVALARWRAAAARPRRPTGRPWRPARPRTEHV